jgi:hypothetical protein
MIDIRSAHERVSFLSNREQLLGDLLDQQATPEVR